MSRRYAAAAGLVAIAAYVAGSWLSASLGVPGSTMLDGLRAPPPYRWVDPPSDLAENNKDPFTGNFSLDLTKRGSLAGSFSTDDGQAGLVISEGSVPPSPGQESLQIQIVPLGPSKFGAPPGDLEIVGNVYQIAATYQPSGEEVAQLRGGGDQRVLLVYPVEAGEHRPHTIVSSPDGKRWTKLETNDSAAVQQTQAPITELGYFAVAAPAEASGLSTSAVGIVVLAVILVVLGALVISRNIRRGPPRPAEQNERS